MANNNLDDANYVYLGKNLYRFSPKDFLGSGNYAEVYLGHRTDDNTVVAIKRINKKKIEAEKKLVECLINEMKTMFRQDIDHSHLLRLFTYEENELYYFLIMEFCASDLSKVIKHHKELIKQSPPFQTVSEEERKYLVSHGYSTCPVLSTECIGRFFVHLTLGLEALHAKNFLHRDLKTDNILLTTNPMETGWDDCVLKIADLGFSRELEKNNLAQTMCGTPLYMAPEVISAMPYEKSADIWSLGCILYEMFTGRVPFLANNPLQLANLIRTQGVFYPSYIPDDAKELIHQLVRKSPNNRFTLAQIRETAFFKKYFAAYQLPKASNQPVKSHPLPPKPKRAKNADPNKPQTSQSQNAAISNANDSPSSLVSKSQDNSTTISPNLPQKPALPGTPVAQEKKNAVFSTPLPSNSPFPSNLQANQQPNAIFSSPLSQQQQNNGFPSPSNAAAVANPPPIPQRRAMSRIDKLRGLEEKKKMSQDQK